VSIRDPQIVRPIWAATLLVRFATVSDVGTWPTVANRGQPQQKCGQSLTNLGSGLASLAQRFVALALRLGTRLAQRFVALSQWLGGAAGPTICGSGIMALGRGWPNDLWLWKCDWPNDLWLCRCGSGRGWPNDLWLWKCGCRARLPQQTPGH
jgi:hypothetical protein